MSMGKKLIGLILNRLFVRRDRDYPEIEVPDTVNTLEDIVRQVKDETATSQQMLEVKEFFAPTHVMVRKASNAPAVSTNPAASAVSHKDKPRKKARLTARQYEALIEKDLTVLEIIGQVIDRNMAIRSQLKTSPS